MLNLKTVNSITILVIIGLLIGYSYNAMPLWIIILILIIWLLITMAGSAFIGWNFHFKSLNSNNDITENHIAITFDDGPRPEFTPQVLSLLNTYNAKGTFFCVGEHIKANSDLFKTIINQGHTVGNHTYSHTNKFGFLSTAKVVSELQETNRLVKDITGLELLLYRPAFGVTNPRIKRALKITGLQSIGWNKRSLDTTTMSKDKILKRITHNLKPGDVILLHDTSEKSIAVLEQLLLFLQQQNIVSVTIDKLFNIKAYA